MADGDVEMGTLNSPVRALSEAEASGGGTSLKSQASFTSSTALLSDKDQICMRFVDVNYTVKVPNPEKKKEKMDKQILFGATGGALPHRMLSIMGPSGSGKTTLLNVLAGRIRDGLDGSITFNGDTSVKKFRRRIAYVMQDDILLKNLSVRELLTFSANIRLDNEHYTKAQKLERVEAIIAELGLEHAADTRIGDGGLTRGVSGGERKRTSVGVELITMPSAVFLDEPSSGLDSYTAETLVETLRQVARSGRTVVTTIHQPSSEIYNMFDDLMLLARGHVVYYGPACDAVAYFASVGYQCPQYTNPSDFFLRLLNQDAAIDKLVAAFKESSQTSAMLSKLDRAAESIHASVADHEEKADSDDGRAGPSRKYAVSHFEQAKLLCERAWFNYAREPMVFKARTAQTVFLAMVAGLIYLQLGTNQRSVQDRAGALFFITVNQSFSSILSVVTLFPSERAVLQREYDNGMYSLFTYFATKIFSELPFMVGYPAFFGTLTYWMMGFDDDAAKFFTFLGMLLLCANTAVSLGILISAGTPNAQVALALAPPVMLPFMLFAGLLVNADSIPPYFIWLEKLSFIKWCYEALMVNEMGGLTFSCTDASVNGTAVACPFPNGEAVVHFYSMDEVKVWENALILAGLCVGFYALAFGFLRHNVRKRSAQ